MQNRKIEYAVILGGWALVFALPALYLYYESMGDGSEFDMREFWMTWSQLLPLFVIFLLHHFFLLPLYSQRRFVVYAFLVVVLLGCFSCYQICVLRPHHRGDRFHRMEAVMPPPEIGDGQGPDVPFRPGDFPVDRELRRLGPRHDFFRTRTVVNGIIALLMMGVDLGIFVQVVSRRERRKLLALQKEKLEMELGYLKYQVNPHFFMNTLNNIHALIDIDTERAKRTIIDLSHMLRYALYDSAVERVPLSKEIEFLRLYISLMRIRFTDSVQLNFEVRDNVHELMVPPVLLICFVENAFKHGVSNREKSFVDIRLGESADGHFLQFDCINSRLQHARQDDHQGIGIANARKRLDLLYGDTYSLVIDDSDPLIYRVCLKLPKTIS